MHTSRYSIQNAKKILVSLIVIIICLILANKFPVKNAFQEITREIFFLILVPFLYIKFILKEKISNYGLNLKNTKVGIIWSIIALVESLVISYLLVEYTEISKNYEIIKQLSGNFYFFLIYELIFINILVFIYEYFFRGFILFTFAPWLGYKAIIIPIVIYWIMIFITDNLIWSITPAAVLTFTSAVATYKSQSFIYSYVSALVYIIIFHSYLIYLLR